MSDYLRARKLELAKPNDYLMVNRFYTAVEGEGITIGQPKWFLRFQGCSVGCKWCDSKETWKFEGFEIADFSVEKHAMFKIDETHLDDMITYMRSVNKNIHHISITGGEPLQQNMILLKKLVEKLVKHSFKVQIETSGQTTPTPEAKEILEMITYHGGLVSVDFKTPSSGVKPNLDMIAECLKQWNSSRWVAVQLKAVVADMTDYEATKEAYNNLMRKWPKAEYIITPCWEPGKERKLGPEWFKMFMDDKEWYSMPKVIMQQHKSIFGTDDLDS